MRSILRSPFVRPTGELREGWFAAIFLAGLLAMLAPLLIWSQHVGREVSLLEQALLIMVVTWACQRLRKRPLAEVLGPFSMRWPVYLAMGAMIGALLMLIPALLLGVTGALRWEATATPLSPIWSGIMGMLLVAAAEELLFRGFLFQRLIGATGIWPAQIAMSALFLLTHFDNPGMIGATKLIGGINIFAASLLFGLAYIRTRSIAMPIGIHWMANAVQGPLLGHGVSGNTGAGVLQPRFQSGAEWLTGGTFGLEASLPGTLCVMLALILFARKQKLKRLT